MLMRRALLPLALLVISGCEFGGGEEDTVPLPPADTSITPQEQDTLNAGAEGSNAIQHFSLLGRTFLDGSPKLDGGMTALENTAVIAANARRLLGLPLDGGVAADGGSLGCGSVSTVSTLVKVQLGAAPGCTLTDGTQLSGSLDLRVTRAEDTVTVLFWANDVVMNGTALIGGPTFETKNGVHFVMKGSIHVQSHHFRVTEMKMTFSATSLGLDEGKVAISYPYVDYQMSFWKVVLRKGDCYPSAGTIDATAIGEPPRKENVYSVLTFDAETPTTAKIKSTVSGGRKSGSATLAGHGASCGGGGAPVPGWFRPRDVPWTDIASPSFGGGNEEYTNGELRIVVAVDGERSSAQAFVDGERVYLSWVPPYVFFTDFGVLAEGPHELFSRATLGPDSFDSVPHTVVVDRVPPFLLRHSSDSDAGYTPYAHDPLVLEFSEAIRQPKPDAGSITLTRGLYELPELTFNARQLTLLPVPGAGNVQVGMTAGFTDRAGNPLAPFSFSYDLDAWSRSLLGRSEAGNSALGPGVGVSDWDGTTYFAWYERKYTGPDTVDPAATAVRVRRISPGSNTLLPALPVTDPGPEESTQVAPGFVAFVSNEPAGPSLSVARFDDPAWTILGGPRAGLRSPKLTVDLQGSPAVAAIADDGLGGSVLRVSRFIASGPWGTIFSAPLADGGTLEPNAGHAITTFTTNPRLAVAWVERVGGHTRVKVASSDISGANWTVLEDLNINPNADAHSPSLFYAPTGYLTAAWVEDDGSGPNVYAARVWGNTTATAPWTVYGGPLDVELSAAALDPVVQEGDFGGPYVAWRERSAQGKETIHVANYESRRQWALLGGEPVASAHGQDMLSAPALALHSPKKPDGGYIFPVPVAAFSVSTDGGAFRTSEVGLARLNGEVLSASPLGAPPGTCQPLSNGVPHATLSATNCFTNLGASPPVAADLLPYGVVVPQWSDGADKRFWFSLPPDASVRFEDAGAFFWPSGSTLVEELGFEREPGKPTSRRPVETRLLLKREDAGWEGYSYQWNDAFTDATLLPGGTTTRKFFPYANAGDAGHWQVYPARTECLRCHNAAAGNVLGPRVEQLSRNFDFGPFATDQLSIWIERNVFGERPEPYYDAHLASPLDPTEPLHLRVRGYLDANCAHCHRPGAEGATRDFRYDTPLSSTGLCADVHPGDAGTSPLHFRISTRDGGHFPGTDRVDARALGLIDTWVNRLSACP